ncbi:helix-turn-helix transcriptional regulator [archaeon]|nr:helix-turn-helix transcriptional regulator [archaeon]MBT7380449.1 helix-turn-helix transcriptional regulator [archaeon]
MLQKDKEKIECLLSSADISKRELAKRVRVSPQSISNFLSGKYSPHKKVREKVYPILKGIYLELNQEDEDQFKEEFGFINNLSGYEVTNNELIENKSDYFNVVWGEIESRINSLAQSERLELRPLYMDILVKYVLSSNKEREQIKEGLEKLILT